jgi:hypothetical protein
VTGDDLARFTRHHLREVPYENVSKWLTLAEPAPAAPSLDWWAEQRACGLGGTCLSLAVMATLQLEAAGVECAPVASPSLDHAAVLAGDRVVDVGFFAPFWAPLPLDRPTRWPGVTGTFRADPTAGGLRLTRPSGLVRALDAAPVDPARLWHRWRATAGPADPMEPSTVIVQRIGPAVAHALHGLSLRTWDRRGMHEAVLPLAEARRLVGRDLRLDPVAWERAVELAAAGRGGG